MPISNNQKKKAVFLSRFIVAEQGTVLPLFGLALFAILGAVGVSIDYGRAQMVQAKLHSAIDAAGLAAAAVSNSRNVDMEVRKFAEANFPQGYMETEYTIDPVNNTGDTINIQARGSVDTTFMRIFGVRDVPVAAYTQVTRSTPKGLELVMVLDNSHSMSGTSGGVSRRDAMVKAAKEATDILYNTYDPNQLFVGIVPFNHQVYVGNAKAPAARWVRSNSGSSTARNDAVTCIMDTNVQRPVQYAPTVQPPTAATPNTLYNLNQLVCGTGFDKQPASMSGLRNNKAQLQTDLDGMVTEGYTRVDLGTTWAWRMLDPSWRGLWNHANATLPLNYDSGAMDKAVIILSDGTNHPHNDPDVNTAAKANTRLANACTAMKAQKIIIYTIVFQESDAGINTLMRNCATASDYYYYVASNESIASVFRDIAESLISLRISR